MERIRLGIVAAEFNYDITFAMVELAKDHARFLECDVVEVVRVPGVFDMPLVVKKLLQRDDIDGLVALGAVIEGSTEHDEIVAQHASRKIADLALDYEKPVGLGITGPGMSRLEAHQRVGYAKRAVEAAVKMIKTLRAINNTGAVSTTYDNTLPGIDYSDRTPVAAEQKDAPPKTDEDDPLSGFFKEFG
jgi:6,7-dimethyl-8-ribityllumazine synthase